MQDLNSNNCIQYFSIKNKNNNSNKTLGFSLIELSIVLIIIGLLVAGITSGQSLIESAKIRAAINELNGLKQGTLAFYSANGRLPGDIKNKGKIGYNSGYSKTDYPVGTFASPYNTDTKISEISAPFVEMYIEGVNDFKPIRGAKQYQVPPESNGAADARDGMVPISKILKRSFYIFKTLTNSASPNWYNHNIREDTPYLALVSGGVTNTNSDLTKYDGTQLFTIKVFKQIDEKLDDGKHNSGSIRSSCGENHGAAVSSTYEHILQRLTDGNIGLCTSLYYCVDL